MCAPEWCFGSAARPTVPTSEAGMRDSLRDSQLPRRAVSSCSERSVFRSRVFNLNVLLRQAGGLESFSPIGVGAHADDFAVLHLVEPRGGLVLEIDTAGTTASAPATKREDSIPEIVELVREDLEEFPVCGEVFEPAPNSVVSAIDTAFEDGHDRNPFHIGVEQLQECGNVPSVEGLDRAAHRFYVFPRHRAGSIARPAALR